MKLKWLLAILLILKGMLGQAQNPPDIQWNTIKTPHFEVVFPAEINKKGLETAHILEHIYKPVSDYYGVTPKPISVFIYNQTLISNGWVSIAPRLSVFMTTPPQDIAQTGASNWMQNLAVHEFRHVVQQQAELQGATRIANFLYGELGWAALQYSKPRWYDEGDAVLAETLFTNGGRGRSPEFDMGFRALAQSDKRYSYAKTHVRSYKHYIPNHYALGYLLTTYVRKHYGETAWPEIQQRTTRYSFIPFAFSYSMRKTIGTNIRKTFHKAMDELDSIYTINNTIEPDGIRIKNKRSNAIWTDYLHPQFANGNNIVALKYGYADAAAFVLIDSTGNETKICNTGNYEFFSAANNKLLWAEHKTDKRWGERDYNNIYITDMKENSKPKVVLQHTKLLSPTLSPDGSLVVAVEYNTKAECRLKVFETKNFEELYSFLFSDNEYVRQPSISEDNRHIAYTLTAGNNVALCTRNLQTKIVDTLLHTSTEMISKPVFYNRYVLYNSSYSGINNVYAIHRQTKKQYRLTNHQIGVQNVDINTDEQTILFQQYTINGYNIASLPLDIGKWKEIEQIQPKTNYYPDDIKTTKINDLFKHFKPEGEYQITPYKQWKNLLNIHSWGLFIAGDPAGENVKPVLEMNIYSRNKLNNLFISAGFGYDYFQNSFSQTAGFSYSKYFPVVGFTYWHGKRYNHFSHSEFQQKLWNDNRLIATVDVPLNLSYRNVNSYLTLSSELQCSFLNYHNTLNDKTIRKKLFPTRVGFQFDIKKQKAVRDAGTRLGMQLNYNNRIVLNQPGTNYAQSVYAGFYLPGFFKHHNMFLNIGYQEQNNSEGFSYGMDIHYPRGNEYSYFYTLTSSSINYGFPIMFPDFNLLNLLYFKRVNGLVFYDYASGKNQDKKMQQMKGFGGRILFEVFTMKAVGAEIVVETAYNPNSSAFFTEFLITKLIY